LIYDVILQTYKFDFTVSVFKEYRNFYGFLLLALFVNHRCNKSLNIFKNVYKCAFTKI